MIKVTPQAVTKIVRKKDKLVKKIYNDKGFLTIKSEYNRKDGKLVKDVFMNADGDKPLHITTYDANGNVKKETFFKENGSYIGTVDYRAFVNNLNYLI